MPLSVVLLFIFVIVFSVTIYFSRKDGSKSARLESEKAELQRLREEYKREQKIRNSVAGMSDSDVRDRLQDI